MTNVIIEDFKGSDPLPDINVACGLVEQAFIDSASDARTINNVMRHEYKVLSSDEKADMLAIKDLGLDFHAYLDILGQSRELSIAKTKIEEAVMWAVKHITK